MDWDKLLETTKDALKDMLAEESAAIAEDKARLEIIAGDIVGYLKLKMTGDAEEERNADRILRHLKMEAQLLAARHEVKAKRIVAVKVELIARTALALLRAGIKAAL